MNGIRTLAHLVELIATRCIDWKKRDFDHDECLHLIRVYLGLEKEKQ